MKDLTLKQKKLQRILARFDALAVAFSGGVDSTYLVAEAQAVLGNRLLAVTDRSAFHPRREIDAAVRLAGQLGVRHVLINSKVESLDSIKSNPSDRCYHCKQAMIDVMGRLAQQHGIAHIAHGANLDDLDDYRPGLRAAEEASLHAPLVDAGLRKTDIRRLSKTRQLPTWNKPSMACLATRIPYGVDITSTMLSQIDQAEDYLQRSGFSEVRVRHHGRVARIEIPHRQLERFMNADVRTNVVARLRELGFDHVALDLEGYVGGSMNRSIRA